MWPVEIRPHTRELIERALALLEQASPPGLGALEALGFLGVVLAARGQRSADGLEVDLAHQLADVLPLAGGSGTAANSARVADGLEQSLRQAKRLELRLAQADQRLAQILSGMCRALALALAWRFAGVLWRQAF